MTLRDVLETRRTVRGGSWAEQRWVSRCATLSNGSPRRRSLIVGLRLMRRSP